MSVNTFIVREARFSGRLPFSAAAKPWGLYVMKIGRKPHEIGHFETREQAVTLARVLTDERGDIRME